MGSVLGLELGAGGLAREHPVLGDSLALQGTRHGVSWGQAPARSYRGAGVPEEGLRKGEKPPLPALCPASREASPGWLWVLRWVLRWVLLPQVLCSRPQKARVLVLLLGRATAKDGRSAVGCCSRCEAGLCGDGTKGMALKGRRAGGMQREAVRCLEWCGVGEKRRFHGVPSALAVVRQCQSCPDVSVCA